MGNQPSGWLPPPYMNVYGCSAYYFLDADNPAVVTPNTLALYLEAGAILTHGEWQTLLDFSPMLGPVTMGNYYGLSIPTAMLNDFVLDASENGEVLPTGYELIIEAPTAIPAGALIFDWNNTQTWTWQQVGHAAIVMQPSAGGGFAQAAWTPSVGPSGAVPQNVGGVMMTYLRLRLVTAPVVAPSLSVHQAFPFGVSAANPIADGWAIVGN